MVTDEERTIKGRIDRIRLLTKDDAISKGLYEAASLAQSVVHDTVGGSHPIMSRIEQAGASTNYSQILGVCRALVELYDQGALKSPRLTIAREIEGDILNLAQAQAQAAELSKDPAQKQVQLGIAAFLAGATIEDALRRLCDAHGVTYDTQKSSIAKLQTVLYQPSKQIEIISQSENKQITAWGDTRNKGDHGKFADITLTEVVSMIMGVRSFIEKHLP
jgi:hypothetical protein